MADGNAYTKVSAGNIVKVDPPKTEAETVLIKTTALTTVSGKALSPQSYTFSADNNKLLVFTNTAKVENTGRLLQILDIPSGKLYPTADWQACPSLDVCHFARYEKSVCSYNLFVEDIASGIKIKKSLTTVPGTDQRHIDWVYEEEFDCRDGFAGAPTATRSLSGRWMPIRSVIIICSIPPTAVTPAWFRWNIPKVGSPFACKDWCVADVSSGFLSNGCRSKDAFAALPATYGMERPQWDHGAAARPETTGKQTDLLQCHQTAARTFWAENDDAWVDANSFEQPWKWINKDRNLFLWVRKTAGVIFTRSAAMAKLKPALPKAISDIDNIRCIDEANNYI